jgi:hypothetical protein
MIQTSSKNRPQKQSKNRPRFYKNQGNILEVIEYKALVFRLSLVIIGFSLEGTSPGGG